MGSDGISAKEDCLKEAQKKCTDTEPDPFQREEKDLGLEEARKKYLGYVALMPKRTLSIFLTNQKELPGRIFWKILEVYWTFFSRYLDLYSFKSNLGFWVLARYLIQVPPLAGSGHFWGVPEIFHRGCTFASLSLLCFAQMYDGSCFFQSLEWSRCNGTLEILLA